ncbi:DUF2474 domain-containing protein [Erwinia oleae]|uniref:DUF2474 domain-containing protein n=1 Tax=Erwinia oleae TaxID=796334 RepID=UPI0009077680|nr:DUF2474 domain-containing protein [Erwinia oleae]
MRVITDSLTGGDMVSPLWKRLMWLVVIYAGSVLALGVVATLFRLMMTAAGMKSH